MAITVKDFCGHREISFGTLLSEGFHLRNLIRVAPSFQSTAGVRWDQLGRIAR